MIVTEEYLAEQARMRREWNPDKWTWPSREWASKALRAIPDNRETYFWMRAWRWDNDIPKGERLPLEGYLAVAEEFDLQLPPVADALGE